MPHLDVYNEEGIDEGDYEALSPEARAAAEREMRKRDRQDDLVHGRARPALLYGECVTVCVVQCTVCMVCVYVVIPPHHPSDESEADEDQPPARKRRVDRSTDDQTGEEDQVTHTSVQFTSHLADIFPFVLARITQSNALSLLPSPSFPLPRPHPQTILSLPSLHSNHALSPSHSLTHTHTHNTYHNFIKGPEMIENLEDQKGHPLREWVSMAGPRAEIKSRFKIFLRTYVNENGINIYREKIKQMCEGGH